MEIKNRHKCLNKLNKIKAQNIVEYLLSITAVIAAIVIAASTIFKSSLDRGLQETASEMQDTITISPGIANVN